VRYRVSVTHPTEVLYLIQPTYLGTFSDTLSTRRYAIANAQLISNNIKLLVY